LEAGFLAEFPDEKWRMKSMKEREEEGHSSWLDLVADPNNLWKASLKILIKAQRMVDKTTNFYFCVTAEMSQRDSSTILNYLMKQPTAT
jgi:hypothetical protein